MDGFVVFLIYFIISGIVWGVVTQKNIENKGYDENWFWWGFFFELLAVLVAFSKPQQRETTNYYAEKKEDPIWMSNTNRMSASSTSDGWKCICGRTNQLYTGTCGCGRTKEEVEETKKAKVAKSIAASRGFDVNKSEFNETKQQIHTEAPVKNETNQELHSEIPVKKDTTTDKFEEIKKYHELLTSGIITQEEFEKKKKELLGL